MHFLLYPDTVAHSVSADEPFGRMANPNIYQCELWTAPASSVGEAAASAFKTLLEEPPMWVANPEPRRLVVGRQRTPTSKVRATLRTTPTERDIGELQADKSDSLVGASLDWAPGSEQAHLDSGEPMWTTFAVHQGDSREDWPAGRGVQTWDCQGYVGHELDSEAFGESVLQLASLMARSAGSVWWGYGGFGLYRGVPPYVRGNPHFASDTSVPGYGYVTFLGPRVVEIIGGSSALEQAPVDLMREVTTRSGEKCVVTVLANAPTAVDENRLRSWKRFLEPVLPVESPRLRVEGFERLRIQPEDPQAALPPMLLAEDWPSPDQITPA